MSDLRDLTNALATISKSLTSIENHVANLDAHGTQLREGLHSLRNALQVSGYERDRLELSLKTVQSWMGDFSHKQAEIHDMVTNLVAVRSDDIREVKGRLRKLEEGEETTQS